MTYTLVFGIVVVAALSLLVFHRTVTAVLGLGLTVTEVPPATAVPFGTTGQINLVHGGLALARTMTAASPAGQNATQVAYQQLAMTAGAATINLAAVPGLNGVVQDFTGLRIRAIHIRGLAANVNPITITKGAANGYTGFGAAFSVTLDAGNEAIVMGNQTQVAAGVRTLDVTGTAAQVLEYLIVAGSN